MPNHHEWLECETCGEPIRRLTPEDLHRMARRPDQYIIDCNRCLKELV